MKVIRAFAVLKKAASMANCALGRQDEKRSEAICRVCDRFSPGTWTDISLWRSGRPEAEPSPT